MANQQGIVVSVDEAHRGRLHEVAQALRAAGMQVDSTLDAIGVISGQADAASLDALGQVPGVAHVEAERTFQLRPPESDLQ